MNLDAAQKTPARGQGKVEKLDAYSKMRREKKPRSRRGV